MRLRNATVFCYDTTNLRVGILQPGKADAVLMVSLVNLSALHQVIAGYDGENHITVIQTARQDGRVHVLITHSSADDSTQILLNITEPYERVSGTVLEVLNTVWGIVSFDS